MADTYIQIRANEKDKQEASRILNELGTNLSAVLNMTIKQIILQRRIPFDVALPQDNIVNNVAASMAMEHMPLTKQEVAELEKFRRMSPGEQEQNIDEIIKKYQSREKTYA